MKKLLGVLVASAVLTACSDPTNGGPDTTPDAEGIYTGTMTSTTTGSTEEIVVTLVGTEYGYRLTVDYDTGGETSVFCDHVEDGELECYGFDGSLNTMEFAGPITSTSWRGDWSLEDSSGSVITEGHFYVSRTSE